MQSNEDDSDNESENEISGLILVPEDKAALPSMYNAIKECQELHPDPADVSTDEDEAFEDMIEDGYEEENIQDENGNKHFCIFIVNLNFEFIYCFYRYK